MASPPLAMDRRSGGLLGRSLPVAVHRCEESPGTSQIIELMKATILEPQVGPAHDIAHRTGHEDFATARFPDDPGGRVNGEPAHLPVELDAFACMQADSNDKPQVGQS